MNYIIYFVVSMIAAVIFYFFMRKTRKINTFPKFFIALTYVLINAFLISYVISSIITMISKEAS